MGVLVVSPARVKLKPPKVWLQSRPLRRVAA